MMLNLLQSAKDVFDRTGLRLGAQSDRMRAGKVGSAIKLRNEQDARQALLLILREVAKHGASKVVVESVGGDLVYRFVVGSGRSAQGTVNLRLKNALFEVVAQNSGQLGLWLADLFGYELIIQADFPVTHFVIAWGQEESIAPPQTQPELAVTQTKTEVLELVREVTQVKETLVPTSLVATDDSVKSPINILVVEDNHTFSKVLGRFLDRYGMAVVCVNDGRQALDLLNQNPLQFDAIVCDLHMPGVNGLEFLNSIRKRAEFGPVPIIMLTSDDDIETELRLLGEGADAFVPKNADPRLLEVQLKRLISKSKAGSLA